MTEHTEPRRWKRPLGYLDPIGVGGTEEGMQLVAVREDTATKADVEAVADWLARNGGPEFSTGLYRAEARSLLSTIFKGGEQ